MSTLLRLVSLLATVVIAADANTTSAASFDRPQLDEGIFLLGKFNGFSDYDSVSKYNLSNPSAGSLYKLSSDDDTVTPLAADAFNGTAPSKLYNIDNTSLLAIVDGVPYIYDTNAKTSTQLSGWDDVTGDVDTALVDTDSNLAYLGGTIEYNESVGALVYDFSDNKLSELPFQGFSSGSSVYSIVQYEDNVVFGGIFTQLGDDSLQSLNTTTNTTSEGTYVDPDQLISMKYATITTANSDNSSDASSIICPNEGSWLLSTEQVGGTWKVQFPYEVTPSKLRLYNGDDSAVKLFRGLTAPSNSILNLTYIDPETLEISHCDADCPLASISTLKSAIANASDATDGVYEVAGVDDVQGTLGFSEEYQEFEFVNELSLNAFVLQILDNYGDTSELKGIQLFRYGLEINANNTLNEPGCSDQDVVGSSSSLGASDWVAGYSGDYLTTNVTASDLSSSDGYKFDSNLPSSGNFTFLFYTPGCGADETCDYRGSVNVTVYAPNGTSLASEIISQNNENDKYDTVYEGDIEITNSDDAPYLEMTFDSASTDDDTVVFVAQKVSVLYNSIDYNSTTTEEDIVLNGLFEYSPANFTDDVEYPVGNTTINKIGASLSSNASVNGLALVNTTKLYVGGDFDSEYGSNFFGIDIDGYSDSYEEISATEFVIDGGFNGAVQSIAAVGDGILISGDFTETVNSSNTDADLLTFYNGSFVDFDLDKSVSSVSTFEYNGTTYIVADVDSSTSNSKAVDTSDSASSLVYNMDGETLQNTSTLGFDLSQASSGYAYGAISKFDSSASHAAFLNSSSYSGVDQSLSSMSTGIYINSTTVALGGEGVVLLGDSGSQNLSSDLSFDGTVTTLYTDDEYLYVGFSGKASYNGDDIVGLLAYNLASGNITYPVIESGSVNTADTDPVSGSVLVGGNFTSSDCSSFCLYNASENTLSSAVSDSLSGVECLRFYQGDSALVSGDLDSGNIGTYNSSSQKFSVESTLSKAVPGAVTKFDFATMNDTTSTDSFIAVLGDDFVGYLDDAKYTSLLDGIETNNVVFSDIALVNSTSNSTAFLYGNQQLLLSGLFNLTSYGQVSSALYNGKQWFPLLLTATDLDTGDSVLKSIVRTSSSYSANFNSTSPETTSSSKAEGGLRYLTKGQTVGVGCALALGTTFLLVGLGAAVWKLGSKSTSVAPLKSRVGEEKMMAALPPGEVIGNMQVAKGQ